MGLYDDIPGRDPAVEAPQAYQKAEGLVKRLREVAAERRASPPEIAGAAEYAIAALRPLAKEFFDHQGLHEWTAEAESLLRQQYEWANLPPPLGLDLETDCYPGLLEARLKLAEALRKPDLMGLTVAELAFKHVLHHAPGAEPARRGLEMVQGQMAAFKEQQDALAKENAKLLAERRGWPVERKLKALTELCQWPEVTDEGLCPACCFRETETSTVASVESLAKSDQVRLTRPVGCAYRLRLVAPLLRLGETPGAADLDGLPEAARLQRIFACAPAGEKANLEETIRTLFELSLGSSRFPSSA